MCQSGGMQQTERAERDAGMLLLLLLTFLTQASCHTTS